MGTIFDTINDPIPLIEVSHADLQRIFGNQMFERYQYFYDPLLKTASAVVCSWVVYSGDCVICKLTYIKDWITGRLSNTDVMYREIKFKEDIDRLWVDFRTKMSIEKYVGENFWNYMKINFGKIYEHI